MVSDTQLGRGAWLRAGESLPSKVGGEVEKGRNKHWKKARMFHYAREVYVDKSVST